MSWFFGGKKEKQQLTAEGVPSDDMCKIYRDSMEFVISNLKFALVGF